MKKQKGRKLTKRQQELLIKKKKRKRRMRIILAAEIIILCLLGTVAFGMFKLGKLNINPLNKENVEINDGFEQKGYTNIALFGTDNRKGETEGVRSDCMIVASIDNDTKQVRLLSVYRDTLLQQEGRHYDKANSAYASGGPEEAVNLLNRNLDLDITDYVSVNMLALADVIDLLGGITLDLTYEEVCHMNNYCVGTSEITGKDYTPIDPEVAGTYDLNGVQAVSYARNRYTGNGDVDRTNRQRIVIQKIADKAKKAKLSTLNNIIDTVLPEISTSFSSADILSMAASMMDYSIGESAGFPFELETPDSIPGYSGSYVVPVGLTNNVKQAHAFLLPSESYTPSEKIIEINDDISYATGIYPKDDGGEMTGDNSSGE